MHKVKYFLENMIKITSSCSNSNTQQYHSSELCSYKK